MGTKRKRNKSRSEFLILADLSHQARIRNCDGCGSHKLTIDQGARGFAVMENSRILCWECRDRELPVLTLKLRSACEGPNCQDKASELHPCRCGVHLLCRSHHVEIHLEEERMGINDDYLFRYVHCCRGIQCCKECPEIAETSCFVEDDGGGHSHYYCDLHHKQACPFHSGAPS